MIVVKIFGDNAKNFKGMTVANEWEEVIRQLKLYFRDIEEIKQKIIAGQVVILPYFSLQKDRRCRNVGVKNERRLVSSKKQLSGRARG